MSESESDENAIASSDSTASPNILQPRQPMAPNYLLVWIDTSIDETNKDCQETLAQLKSLINHVVLCTELDRCIQVLNKVDKERVFVITSYLLGQHFVPEIHGTPQLEAIYIFCGDESGHQKWTQNWAKIKGIHTNMKDICQALQADVKQYNQDSIAMSFVTVNELASIYDLNQLEPTFMYTQIFKDILLNIKYGEQAIKQFIAYCRLHDCGSTKNIDEFEKKYQPQLAIYWYTRPTFIFSMLNDGLRTMNADIIITMGFFLRDVHRQIQQLYERQVSHYDGKPFEVYRGQGLMKSDFEKLQKTQGGLMSFNNFLSTSKDKEISIGYADTASTVPDKVGVLFIMSIDPCIKSTPFASIEKESYYKEEEEEILFSMHTVFRVGTIKQMDNNDQLYQVELQLTSDGDQQLRELTDRIREEASGTEWQRLGDLLLKIGQFNKAEELYKVLLEQTSNETEKAFCYVCLGYAKNSQRDYEMAIWYYIQGIELYEKTLPSIHPNLATSYNNFGNVYCNMGQYLKALSFYEKALEIRQKALPSNSPHLANSYSNIGNVYTNIGEYSNALSFYEKAREIKQKTLPSNHPSLAISYNNIGLVYNNMGDYWKALSLYKKALEIFQKTLPSNHPDLANSLDNIGMMHWKMGDYSKALSFFEKVLQIRQKTLPSNHPDLANSYNNIGLLYNNMGEYSKAFSLYKKALEIRQKTLLSNHPDLATLYDNFGNVYCNMGQYLKALSFYEKALEIREKILPSNHLDLATLYDNIGVVHRKMGDYSKALSFLEKALEIFQKTLPSNHPGLANSYNNIGLVYFNMEEYSKALSYYEKDVKIREKILPSNHPDLAISYNNISTVYSKIRQYSKALSFLERALEIYQKTLPSNHPDLATLYDNIGCLYVNMEEYSKALSFFEKVLQIRQKTLPSNHPDLATLHKNISLVREKIDEYSKALSSLEKDVKIREKTLPSNHPDLATSYN
ncbi:unnamed protein product, partial [Adineta steineri]